MFLLHTEKYASNTHFKNAKNSFFKPMLTENLTRSQLRVSSGFFCLLTLSHIRHRSIVFVYVNRGEKKPKTQLRPVWDVLARQGI